MFEWQQTSRQTSVLGEAYREVHATEATVDGQLVYAIGDVHGRYDLLKSLLGSIESDVVVHAKGRRPVLIMCGDYVDRGPESASVLDALSWLRRKEIFELHLLKGNHEQMLLAFIEAPERMSQWLLRHGAPTLASYGVTASPAYTSLQLTSARDELLDCMPASHLELLRSLRLMVSLGDYAFVHAGVQPGKSLSAQTEEALLWIREDFLDDPGPFPKVIVHGHSWSNDKPTLLPHRLGIDTGAYRTGVLTAVRLEDREVTVIQAHSELGPGADITEVLDPAGS
jgi:serine/threonine protein phosphatase 1